jgi:arylsulfatase A-like enzyme
MTSTLHSAARPRRGVASIAVVALLACGAGLTAGCDRSPPPERGSRATATERGVDNVVLISIDSLRADHLGVYGYGRDTSPALDALAREGLVFDRAYSTTSWTLPSHTAMLTGLDDRAHGIRDHTRKVPPEIPTLAEELGKHAVRTVGFYSGPYLHPTFGLARGFAEYRNCSSVVPADANRNVGLTHFASFKDETNPLILASLRQWLQGGGAGPRNFIFIHMWDVHYSYQPPERYVQMFDPDYAGDMDGTLYNNERVHAEMDPRDLQHIIARYDGEIRYTDDTIAEILDLLRDAGLLESSAIIVTSDHGEEFFEHGNKGHQQSLFEEVLRIPLIFHIPGRSPAESRIDKVVSLIDLYPTVCELMQSPCAVPGSRGESLVKFHRGGNAVAARDDALANLSTALTTLEIDSLVADGGKIMRWQGGNLAGLSVRKQLPEQVIPTGHDARRGLALYFDREAMARERHGWFAGAGDAEGAAEQSLARLEARVAEADRLRALTAGASGGHATDIDEQTQERLRALGYME